MKEIFKTIANFFKKRRSEIVVGVVVWIFTTVLHRGFEWIKGTAPTVGKNVFNFVVDHIYEKAAQQSSNSIILTLFSLVLGIYLAYLLITAIKGYRMSIKSIKAGRALASEKIEDAIITMENLLGQNIAVQTPNEEGRKLIKSGKKNSYSVHLSNSSCILLFLLFLDVFYASGRIDE